MVDPVEHRGLDRPVHHPDIHRHAGDGIELARHRDLEEVVVSVLAEALPEDRRVLRLGEVLAGETVGGAEVVRAGYRESAHSPRYST